MKKHLTKFKNFLNGKGTSDPVGHILEKKNIILNCRTVTREEAVKACGKDLKLVYTPVHGSGYIPVTTILKKIGINATVVAEQTCKDTKGKEKKRKVLDWLHQHGIVVDEDQIDAMIEAAVFELKSGIIPVGTGVLISDGSNGN